MSHALANRKLLQSFACVHPLIPFCGKEDRRHPFLVDEFSRTMWYVQRCGPRPFTEQRKESEGRRAVEDRRGAERRRRAAGLLLRD